MPEAKAVLIPLLNPNEPTSRLSHLAVSTGDRVTVGDALATCESTKGVEELVSPRDGFVCGLTAAVGDVCRAGDPLCWIADSSDWAPPEKPVAATTAEEHSDVRITRPAREFAESLGIQVEQLPVGPLITKANLRTLAGMTPDVDTGHLLETYPEEALLVYGGGGHGKSLIELIRAEGRFTVVGVIDDGLPAGSKVLDVPVLGGRQLLAEARKRGAQKAVNAVGGIGTIQSRIDVFRLLKEEGFECPTVIHPSAWIEPSANMEHGVQVFPHAYVGSDASLAFGVIINTSAVVSHDCHIGRYANIAPGSLLAGGVCIGEAVLVGMGVTVNLDVSIGARARVGNSAVVKSDVPRGSVVRAGSVWPVHPA